MKQGGKHLLQSFFLGITVIILLLAAQFVPSITYGGVTLKKINILSDVTVKEKLETDEADTFYEDSLKVVRDSLELLHQQRVLASREDSIKQLKIDSIKKAALARIDSLKDSVVPIEDYSIEQNALAAFYSALNQRNTLHRPVRIAFMGDSFIEGDIIVADVREQLQSKFGGAGIGFVPMSSVIAQYTPTVKHAFNHWKAHTILQRDSLGIRFTLNGGVFQPQEGATASFAGVKWKQHLDSFDQARLFYLNEGEAGVTICTNGNDTVYHELEQASRVRQFVTSGQLHSISYAFKHPSQLKLLGVSLEDSSGISVDNYSIRGNSGILMTRVDKELSRQFDNLMHYDLIVLQYGINAVESDVVNYTAYRKQMTKVINHLKECFPNSSFLLLGVGDRSKQEEGLFVTMPGIQGMLKAQKQIATECGIAYWSIFDAMGGENSMVHFVENNWASKDYTHISHAGGRRIGTALVKAILLESEKYKAIYEVENNKNEN